MLRRGLSCAAGGSAKALRRLVPSAEGENKKTVPQCRIMKRTLRNPALARTAPSPTDCAPSILHAAAARNASHGCGGRSANPAPEVGLLFTLCGFLRSPLSRTPQDGRRTAPFPGSGRGSGRGFHTVSPRRRRCRRIRRRTCPRCGRIRRRRRWSRGSPRRFRPPRT